MQAARPKILCIVQLPPPTHGVTVMNNTIIKSNSLNEKYLFDVVNLQFVKSFSGLSKFSVRKIAKALSYSFSILNKIIWNRPDLVYFTLVPTGFAFYRDTFYIMILKLFKLNTLIHLHGKGIKVNAQKNILNRKIYAFALRNSNIICLSESLVEDIRPVYKRDPFIVPNGIEVQPCQDLSNSKKDNKGRLHILYLSNFAKTKGLLVLIEALGILKKQGYDFEARFAGEPYDLTYQIIEEELKMHDLEAEAKIVGPVSGDKKLDEYRNADIFVFPTYFEAFGLVNLEAMQNRLPVISTVEGAIPDIVIDQETGFLVEKENAEMLAERISILLKNQDLRLSMGEKGYQRFLEKYTLDKFEENISAVFEKVLNHYEH